MLYGGDKKVDNITQQDMYVNNYGQSDYYQYDPWNPW